MWSGGGINGPKPGAVWAIKIIVGRKIKVKTLYSNCKRKKKREVFIAPNQC
jgi:hypothetical protein